MPLSPTKSKISQQKVQDLFMQLDSFAQKADDTDKSASRQAAIEMSVYRMASNSVMAYSLITHKTAISLP